MSRLLRYTPSVGNPDPAFVGATTAQNWGSSTGTSFDTVLNSPVGLASGHLLVAVLYNASGDASQVFTVPSGWTQAGSSSVPVWGVGAMTVFWRFAGASEPASYTFTLTYAAAQNRYISAALLAYSGVDRTAPLSAAPVYSQITTATTTPAAPSVTPSTAAGTSLIAFAGYDGALVSAWPTGFTGRAAISDASASYTSISVADSLLTANASTATGTKTPTAGSDQYTAMQLVLNPVSAVWRVAVLGVSGPNITLPGRTPPTAIFTVTYDGATVFFNATASTGGDGTITNYHWNYGDGTETDDDSASEYTYSATGDYLVTLTVTSSLNIVGRYSMTVSPTVQIVTTPNGPPGAWSLVFQDHFDAGALDTSVWDPAEGSVVNGVTATAANIFLSPYIERFTGTDGTLPATWTSHPSSGTVGILSNALQVATGPFAYSGARADLSAAGPMGDTDITGTVVGGVAGVEQYASVVLNGDSTSTTGRWYAGGNSYAFFLEYAATAASSALSFYDETGGAETALVTVPRTLTGTTKYGFRVQRLGQVLRGRVWDAATTEPATWDITYTVTGTPKTGFPGLGAESGSAAAARAFLYDDVTVSDASGASVILLKLASTTSGAEIFTSSPIFAVGDYVEFRANFPGDGTHLYNWPALRTSGPNWPTSGEIDFAEVLGGANGTTTNDLTVNYHHGTVANSDTAEHYGKPGNASAYWGGAFHTYGVHRKDTTFDVYYDGIKVKADVPTNDNGGGQNIIANMGTHTSTAPNQVGLSLAVDYVRQFRPTTF